MDNTIPQDCPKYNQNLFICQRLNVTCKKCIEIYGNKDHVFTHFGHKNFNKNLFNDIKNIKYYSKPNGGLWATDEETKEKWKSFIRNQLEINTDNYFEFTFKKDTRILEINSFEDCKKLHYAYQKLFKDENGIKFIDFEKVTKEYDVLDVKVTDLKLSSMLEFFNSMTFAGWDYNTILVLNKDVIEIKE